jgi:MHS family proline/betaine transporter-like MFS transporter
MPPSRARLIAAGIIGNVLEWYDFAVYGYFAGVMGRQFFPSDNPNMSLLAAFGAFAAGFLMRPFGGVVFGHIGDRVGRKAALTLSVLAMAIPTFLIGLLPGYAQWGAVASVLVVLMRMVQGLSVGGEYTTSIVFLVEGADQRQRGLAGSWSPFGGSLGILMGSASAAVISSWLPAEAVDSWGWRIPFLLGLVVGLAGLYVRQHIPEPTPKSGGEKTGSPILEAVHRERRALLEVAGLNVLTAVGFYLVFVYTVTWFQMVVRASAEEALDINTVNLALTLLLLPLGGALSDRVGRRPVLIASSLSLLLLAWPLFWMMHHPNVVLMWMGQLGLTLLLGMFLGTVPATAAEAYPTEVRCTAVSVGYNVTLGLLGGITPLLATWLVGISRDDLSPAFMLMGAAAVSFAVVLGMRETAHAPLR